MFQLIVKIQTAARCDMKQEMLESLPTLNAKQNNFQVTWQNVFQQPRNDN